MKSYFYHFSFTKT